MTSCRLQSNYSSTVTLHGGPVVLRLIRATPCQCFSTALNFQRTYHLLVNVLVVCHQLAYCWQVVLQKLLGYVHQCNCRFLCRVLHISSLLVIAGMINQCYLLGRHNLILYIVYVHICNQNYMSPHRYEATVFPLIEAPASIRTMHPVYR